MNSDNRILSLEVNLWTSDNSNTAVFAIAFWKSQGRSNIWYELTIQAPHMTVRLNMGRLRMMRLGIQDWIIADHTLCSYINLQEDGLSETGGSAENVTDT